MLRHSLLALTLASLLAACGKGEAPKTAEAGSSSAKPAATAAAQAPLLVAPEDLTAVRNSALAGGPVITGSVLPERRADLRAEVSAVVLQVVKENGDKVEKGDLLVRLDDTAIRENVASAEEAARASGQAFDQAERQFQRLKTLSGTGAVSAQQLEDAEVRRNNAQSDLAAARTRAAQARQQLTRTEVRAPFDGMVSDRKVSAGDTASVGKELLKVIDPKSMRFEGLVSADQISNVTTGAPVAFRVNGFGEQEFTGKVTRVNPSANTATRQVEVLVAFANSAPPQVSGLYAEGRVETRSSQHLMLPESAIVREGDKAFAWRVKDGTLNKVPLVLGERDARRGDYVLRDGLVEGDKVLRTPSGVLSDGLKVELSAPAQSTAEK